jgi:NADPH:quinone reductase-like Zn-dependent oxidoreductase
MMALRAQHRGDARQLSYERAPMPTPGIGDVLVSVHAASFTPAELTWTSTWTDRLGRPRTPVIPGHEVSGVVVELGYGTTGLDVGDAVFGLTDWYRDGAAATHAVIEARNLAPKPATLDHVHAACVPLAASTAWQALFEHGRLRAGQSVLVHGAGGGVGGFAVQLASSVGAEVIATGRGANLAALGELGADRVIDVKRQPFETVVGPVDLVVDVAGGDLARRSWPLVRSGGTLVTAVGGVPEGERRDDARWIFFVVEADRSTLVELARSIDAGELRPVVSAVFPLAQGRQAFEAKLRGGMPGKVGLLIADAALDARYGVSSA